MSRSMFFYLFPTAVSHAGSIPKELGDLNELQRLWLFNNQLSGKMPTTEITFFLFPESPTKVLDDVSRPRVGE